MSFENRYMMRHTISLFTTVFAANAALVLSSGALAQEVAPALAKPVAQEVHFPAMPATPALVTEVLAAIAFEVAAPYEHNTRKDRMMVTRGHVLVLRAPSALLVARQVAEPVLLVGAQTAERINRGFTAGKESGVLIVLVPEWTERGADGVEHAGNPLASRIYFASPELPERVDAAWIAAQAKKADGAKLAAKPMIAAGVALAATRLFADRDALGRFLAELVEEHAPTETDCIEAMRAVD